MLIIIYCSNVASYIIRVSGGHPALSSTNILLGYSQAFKNISSPAPSLVIVDIQRVFVVPGIWLWNLCGYSHGTRIILQNFVEVQLASVVLLIHSSTS